MIRYLTAGESHGPALVGIVEGVPAGVALTPETINVHLYRRQQGYGRGGRMKIEQDAAEILSGVRFGKTIGSPISLVIHNKDWKNWTEKMAQFDDHSGAVDAVSIPRPGHADFGGKLKYGFDDIRPVIDRSSARETATRVACGSIARAFLKELGIEIGSYLSAIGAASEALNLSGDVYANLKVVELLQRGAESLMLGADASPVRMLDERAEAKAIALIDEAKKKGDTLGGVFEVFVTGLPVGLGSYAQFDRKLDAQLAAAIISIQAVKGVEVGTAFRNAVSFGSEVHDEIFLRDDNPHPYRKPYRKTNRAGGIEGGMTNGEVIHIRGAMKPISTLMEPLESFDFESMKEVPSRIERSDTCAAPACAVIAEAVVAPVIANAVLEKFGGDSVEEIKAHLSAYRERIEQTFQKS